VADGVGKSGWLAPSATGLAATTVSSSISAIPKLFADLALARAMAAMLESSAPLGGVQLLILDDWGLEPLEPPTHDPWNPRRTHGRRSTIVTAATGRQMARRHR